MPNDLFKKLDIYFLLTIIFIFSLITLIFFINIELNFTLYCKAGILIIVMLISYFTSVVGSLITSLVIIFIYGSYYLFNNIVYQQSIEMKDYIWIIIYPLTAFLFSRFSEIITSIRDEQTKTKKSLTELVTLDDITGFSNSRKFYIDLEEEISRAKRYNSTFSIMLIKIVYYQEIAAIHGRVYVKNIIKRIAQNIDKNLRLEDRKYRLEDDLFAIILPNTKSEGAELLMKRLKPAISTISIEEKTHQIDIQIAFKEYDESIESSLKFKKLVEEELQYDI